MLRIDLVLLRKKPVLWISLWNTAGSAAAYSAAFRYFANNAGVTMFTRASVDWADRIVATSSSSGLAWSRAHFASGNSRFRRVMMLRVRRFFSAGVSVRFFMTRDERWRTPGTRPRPAR